MRRLLSGRYWMVLMIASTGTLPVCVGPCCAWKTHDDRQALLETALSDPWNATPGSTAIPGSFISGWISTVVNDQNGDGVPDATDLQRVLNTVFYSVSAFIESQIDVKNPYGWADLGRPR
ncbi:MAG: hypothetical protein JXQ73_02265 [Phycisphaerae bacterium]|nr:hypothetical protein [Phycisphaerae bacterium]